MANPGSDSTGGGEAPGQTRSRFGADLPIRAAAGVLMMAMALGLAWAGGFWFALFWLAAAVLVLWEWQRLVGGTREWARILVGAVALIAASPYALHGAGHGAGLLSLLVLGVGAVAAGAIADPEHRIRSGLGVIYAGALVVGIVLLRASPQYGLPAVLWLFAIVWGTDVMAYFGGRFVGGPKLWPSVSPGKTWSGAATGAIASAIIGTLLAALIAPQPVKIANMFLLGLGVSIVSQLGDLFESAMKRRAGVKDSSHLIPGHGGLMDRLDGFIVATAVTAVVAAYNSSGTWIASGIFEW